MNTQLPLPLRATMMIGNMTLMNALPSDEVREDLSREVRGLSNNPPLRLKDDKFDSLKDAFAVSIDTETSPVTLGQTTARLLQQITPWYALASLNRLTVSLKGHPSFVTWLSEGMHSLLPANDSRTLWSFGMPLDTFMSEAGMKVFDSWKSKPNGANLDLERPSTIGSFLADVLNNNMATFCVIGECNRGGDFTVLPTLTSFEDGQDEVDLRDLVPFFSDVLRMLLGSVRAGTDADFQFADALWNNFAAIPSVRIIDFAKSVFELEQRLAQ